MIIKLKDVDEIYDYLEIDKNIFTNDSENSYKNEPIYILQYPDAEIASVSEGIGIEKMNEYKIKHLCNTKKGSSGGPIINKITNKVIGLHRGYMTIGSKSLNIGTFLKFPLNELNKTNEIIITIKIDKDDINKDIFFLDNTYEHGNLKELNENNTKLYINDKIMKYQKYFKPEKEGIFLIKLKFFISIKDCSYMFYGCNKLENIELTNFDTQNTYSMKFMFFECKSLKSISGISQWNTINVTDMEGMFCKCISLESLPDISHWNVSNVTNISLMFYNCSSLQSLPDISKWNITNKTNINNIFDNCFSLKTITDIQKNKFKIKAKEYFIGIDFGTSNSRVGIYIDGKVFIVPNSIGEDATPSVVYFTNDNKILVGEDTLTLKIENEKNYIYNVKSFIGLSYEDFFKNDLAKGLNYDVVNINNIPKIKVNIKGVDHFYSAVEICSLIIKKLIQNVKDYIKIKEINETVKIIKALIAVPAHFRDNQINSMKSAAYSAVFSWD